MLNPKLRLVNLASLGVEIICLEENIDPNDPASVLIRAIKLAEPEVDNRRRALNTRMGIRRALKEGRYAAGTPPLGYSWEKNLSKPIIVPNRDAPLVKEAFGMYATGLYTIEFVRKTMNTKGLEIGKTAFNLMLRKPYLHG